jgi:hypothetical protein
MVNKHLINAAVKEVVVTVRESGPKIPRTPHWIDQRMGSMILLDLTVIQ